MTEIKRSTEIVSLSKSRTSDNLRLRMYLSDVMSDVRAGPEKGIFTIAILVRLHVFSIDIINSFHRKITFYLSTAKGFFFHLNCKRKKMPLLLMLYMAIYSYKIN